MKRDLSQPFSNICIIGGGLIGSSIARALRMRSLCSNLSIVDHDESVLHGLKSLGLADSLYKDPLAAIPSCDLVIFATPASAIAPLCGIIARALKHGAVVTDTASVKTMVATAFSKHLPSHVGCVPAHPVAGSEKSGPLSGSADLFDGKLCVLTPTENTDIAVVEAVSRFWEDCGAIIEIMDPVRHDTIYSFVSHLPHLLAYTLMGTMAEQKEMDVRKFAGSGFLDFTRLAASDSIMWRDIFLGNPDMLEAIEVFKQELGMIQKAIRRGDASFLEERFQSYAAARKSLEGGNS